MATASELLHAWLHGTADGGPSGDGRYPLIGADGETYLIKCPAAQALDPSMDPSELEVFANTAVQAANEASAAAESASTSASNAAASASAADTSRSQALSYRNTASTHASTATTKASEAASSATAAAGSASTASTANTNAQSAKTAAETASTKAQDWADKAEDSPVETGKFSARHWALKAAASAASLATLAWDMVQNKPATATRWPTWGEVTDKPGTFTPSSHTHTIANVTGLQSALDGKQAILTGTTAQYVRGDGSVATFPSIPQGTVTSVTGGNGLSGSVTSSGSISLGTPGTLSGSTTNSVSSSSHTHALSANLSAWDGFHPNDAWVYKESIPGGQDLNNYTATGVYHQAQNANASSGTNYPDSVAGMLVVFATSAMVYQTYQRYNTGDVWTRSCYSGSWSAWKLSVDGTTSISAGNGLSGGGNLTSNRTISLGTPGTITATSTNSVSSTSHTHNLDTSGNFSWTGDHTFIGDMIARSGSASKQLTIERTGNTINAAAAYTTTGGTIYAGQGDTGYFNWGTNTDLRWSNSGTWGRIGSGGLEVKGSVSLNGMDISANGSGKIMHVQTAHGYFRAGPNNTSWCHFYTDRTAFYFSTDVAVSGEISFYNGPRVPRTFVQSGDPGSAASTGDLWIW